jgi:predicted dithiol-disulfide oxidoreductase (DUF899 family)
MDKTQHKYITLRKKILAEERKLIYQRDKVNKQLREIRRTMMGWDNWLLNGKG